MKIKELKKKIANIDDDKEVYIKVEVIDEDMTLVKMDLSFNRLTMENENVYLSLDKIINADETYEEPGARMTLEKIKSLAQKEMENCDHESEEYKALFEIYEFIDDMEMEEEDAI